MDKSPDAFRTISEVAELLDTPAHVLRFWESRFPQIKPVKRAGGRRYYRPADVALLSGIRRLLHEEGMTIRGVQKILREQGVRHVATLGGAGFDDDPEAALDAALSETYPARAAEPEGEPETAQVFALATVLRGLDRPGERLSAQLQLFETGDPAEPLSAEDVVEASADTPDRGDDIAPVDSDYVPPASDAVSANDLPDTSRANVAAPDVADEPTPVDGESTAGWIDGTPAGEAVSAEDAPDADRIGADSPALTDDFTLVDEDSIAGWIDADNPAPAGESVSADDMSGAGWTGADAPIPTDGAATVSEVTPLDEVIADFSDAVPVETADKTDAALAAAPAGSWPKDAVDQPVDIAALDVPEPAGDDPWQDLSIAESAPVDLSPDHPSGDDLADAPTTPDEPASEPADADAFGDDPVNIFSNDTPAPAAAETAPDAPDAERPMIDAAELIARMRALPREILIENAGDAAHLHDRLTRLRDRMAAAARGR